ncbi:ABC transporter substrate-binding protein [Pyrobaculum neutrophilum]|uniref:Extracellular ligand-binding receptor n=1 Tax=Pyrobaculum neutrophilum (strain DSM 2338 / JCM 9278 / NBRC 100436 / V24Sta) TaxID=444157 RepID=B1YB23_PYRNV|nr:ABC transporter substrate-binding protein [Pyrobaculum neutrophilum]ACB40723.1 Extracellular ligand-binding receptor [Pyrobaculum neutrophilum V24Sta]
MNSKTVGIIVGIIVLLAIAALLINQQAPAQRTTTPQQTTPPQTTSAPTTGGQTTSTPPQTATQSCSWKLVGMYIASQDKVVFGEPQPVTPPAGAQTPVIVNVTATPADNVVEIGVLQPLSGRLGSLGELARAAAELAADDVNRYLTKIGAPFRVKVLADDTQADPNLALEKLKSLHTRGVKYYLVRTSGEVRQMKQYANDNKLILISVSSTAPGLVTPSDYVFRLPPDDTKQARALAAVLREHGIKAVALIYINNDYGRGIATQLQNILKGEMEVVVAAAYDPQKSEFSAEVSALADKVSGLVGKYGADKVAVVAPGYGELQTIFLTAANYPVLSQVRWYGTDGSTGLKELTDPKVCQFAVRVGGFVSTKFAPAKSAYYDRVRSYILSKYGREPDAYAYNAYDAVWLIALTILQNGGDPDTTKFFTKFPEVAANYFGASGLTKLNQNHDRDSADYALWALVAG